MMNEATNIDFFVFVIFMLIVWIIILIYITIHKDSEIKELQGQVKDLQQEIEGKQ